MKLEINIKERKIFLNVEIKQHTIEQPLSQRRNKKEIKISWDK